MKILTLLKNTTLQKKLTPKHGLSLYIETGPRKILFDTGPDHTFIENARKLNINLIMGGFHLFNPAAKKIEPLKGIQQLVTKLSIYRDTKFYTGHCTGKKAFDTLKKLMKDRLFEFKTGTSITL